MSTDRFLTRVWDKLEKKMFYNVYSYHDIIKNKDRLVPMMCTGLKDKNSKLIYEGDILQEDDWENDGHTYSFSPVVVAWVDNHLDAQEPSTESIRGTIPTKEAKIIGNIYENEKLMEVKA